MKTESPPNKKNEENDENEGQQLMHGICYWTQDTLPTTPRIRKIAPLREIGELLIGLPLSINLSF